MAASSTCSEDRRAMHACMFVCIHGRKNTNNNTSQKEKKTNPSTDRHIVSETSPHFQHVIVSTFYSHWSRNTGAERGVLWNDCSDKWICTLPFPSHNLMVLIRYAMNGPWLWYTIPHALWNDCNDHAPKACMRSRIRSRWYVSSDSRSSFLMRPSSRASTMARLWEVCSVPNFSSACATW